MLPMIALLAAAATPAPACPVPTAPTNAVAISATVMPVEAVAGSYVTGNGWPPPGEARVGLVRYEWGLLLRSDDLRFADFDLSPGPIHSRTSGCWFAWDSHWGKHGIDAISNARISESGYQVGYVPDRPASTPTIASYRFGAADKAFSPDYAWVGLWVAQDGAERTQVVAFDDRHRKLLATLPFRLATLPFRLGGLSTLPGPDNPALGITMIGEGKPGQPVPYLQLLWMSGLHETDPR